MSFLYIVISTDDILIYWWPVFIYNSRYFDVHPEIRNRMAEAKSMDLIKASCEVGWCRILRSFVHSFIHSFTKMSLTPYTCASMFGSLIVSLVFLSSGIESYCGW